nr:hypothetical protein [Tanacetum cinerariifolium]
MTGTGLPCKFQMAVALAASSIAFRPFDPLYANKLLSTATRGFSYADTYSGAYLQAGLKADEAGQTTLRIAQDWKHILGGQKVVNRIEADKGREQVLGIKSGFHEAYKLHYPTNSTTTPSFTSTNELIHDCNLINTETHHHQTLLPPNAPTIVSHKVKGLAGPRVKSKKKRRKSTNLYVVLLEFS